MRPLCGIGFAFAVSLLVAPALLFAQPQTAPLSPPQTSADEENIYRYESAVGLLKKGREFERAIVLLRGLTDASPQNRDYHLALGCAYSCRAAALGDVVAHPASFAQDQQKYKKWRADWEAAQNDPTNPKYRQPSPQPPVLATKDDDKPFLLTPDATKKRYLELVENAQSEWDKTLALSKTPQERADALHTQGWGRRMARKYSHQIVKDDDSPAEKSGSLPSEKQITRDFTEATQICPKNARYWQSLGDALRGDRWRGDDETSAAPAIAAYQTSLKIDSNNASLWYRIYQVYHYDNPKIAEDAMRHAAMADSDNAYFTYRLASAILSGTRSGSYDRPYKPGAALETNDALIKRILSVSETEESKHKSDEALALVEQGNKMPRCKFVPYIISAPNMLIAAWNFQPDYAEFFYETAELGSLEMLLKGYGKVRLTEGNNAEARRAAEALLGVGHRIVSEAMREASLKTSDALRLSTAMDDVTEGYALMQDICKASRDTEGAAQAKSSYLAEWNQYRDFRKAQKDALANTYTVR